MVFRPYHLRVHTIFRSFLLELEVGFVRRPNPRRLWKGYRERTNGKSWSIIYQVLARGMTCFREEVDVLRNIFLTFITPCVALAIDPDDALLLSIFCFPGLNCLSLVTDSHAWTDERKRNNRTVYARRSLMNFLCVST